MLLTDKQTDRDRQTDTGAYITLLAEVIITSRQQQQQQQNECISKA